MKISAFQAVVLAIFGVSLVAGLVVLATVKNKNKGSGVPVVIWGTISDADFNNAVKDLTQGNNGLKMTYVEKRPEGFDQEFLETLAKGMGPDVILLSQDLILRHGDKMAPISYATMPLRTFKDTFVEEGELFLRAEGAIAIPFAVDPLIMYWNRDLLTNQGISRPPVTWDEFLTLVPRLTQKDKSQNIVRSGVSLGEFRNILNAKEIIAALFLQTGNSIVSPSSDGFGFASAIVPATLSSVGAINFYTDFANPVKPNYSWNRALPNSRDLFAAGKLAFYFGFASESSKIRDKNPNLNFDLTFFPQPKGSAVAVTFGKMWGLAVLKNSPNAVDALSHILAITSAGPLALWSEATGLPPVRRDLLSASPADPYQSIFYDSAIRSRGWLDPNPAESSIIFQNMIESVTSGELESGKAIEAAGRELNSSLKRI
ncbi:MAG: Extracellular solute-binding protein family 1 [Parcubacteria group bacterium GW2011_GWA2_47_16]|nr:MAG: Extracellular solute-binding protein family 1 [Parcubacteria group bacterium GW2011_GWA2_47_16]